DAWEAVLNPDYSQDRWELYHVAEDFSEAHDLAVKYPDTLKALQKLFDAEARKNEVYPLGGSDSLGVENEPSIVAGRRKFTYYSDLPLIPVAAAPDFTQSHRIVADIAIPNDGARGTIVSYGSRLDGFALYIKNQKLIYDNNYAGKTHDIITSPMPI